ncbi:DUF2187 domain-containing protein [Oceanobacillus piezotolerans]|uniref:DUF2187 domain-containing protein n=1 Tax=Oceanobacillus piezotolerans TaxID=2448030 RepID=A0A498D1D6_9BACI|nr:DUF2187 family protein [Oceanobacillus piezotolerans]RLL40395.1 DUF2187 domain-containing protein [Oceanobacillus piezotolerans]
MAEDVTEKAEPQVKKADVGDKIKVVKGLQKGKEGKVLIVRENSVIIKTGTHPQTGEPIKTVVNHKNYKKAK